MDTPTMRETLAELERLAAMERAHELAGTREDEPHRVRLWEARRDVWRNLLGEWEDGC
jgi:hypothetical protein